jgi:hypothetical protein
MKSELDAPAQKFFLKRAQETRAVAALPAFRNFRDRFLALAGRYEALAKAGPQSPPAAPERRALP